MKYRVIKPVFQLTGQSTETPGGTINWNRVTWRCIGTADSIEDARAKGFVAPVLEWAGEPAPGGIDHGAAIGKMLAQGFGGAPRPS